MAEKVEAKAFLEFAAGVLGVSEGRLSLETTYGSIPEWDSMAQLRLVVAVDLDNTLWEGVIGEDGLAGIRTKPAFERELKNLKGRGEAEVERLVAARGVERLAARWRETGRNAPVKELFERFGFKQEFESASEKRYSKILTQRHGGTEG